jgi:hypothetical protein
MHEAPGIEEITAQALRITPCPLPPRSLGPLLSWTWPRAARAFGTRRYTRSVHAQHDHRPAPGTRCHCSEALFNLRTRWRHLPYRQPRGRLLGARVQALTPHAHPGEIVPKRVGLVQGHLDDHLGCGVLPIEWETPRSSVQHLVQGIKAPAAGAPRKVRPLQRHHPHQGFHGTRPGRASRQEPLTLGTRSLLAALLTRLCMWEHGLWEPPSERLAQLPHRLGHVCSWRRGLL